MGEAADKPEKGFDPFELATAILLGLGAIGSAWSGLQNDLWGGQQAAAYTESSNLNTKAAKDYQEGVTEIVRDASLDIQAKILIAEAAFLEEGKKPEELGLGDKITIAKNLEIARYLYQQQLSEEGFKALGFDLKYREADQAAEGDGPLPEIPDEVLVATAGKELWDSPEWVGNLLSAGMKGFEAADEKFQEGAKANDISDKFGLNGVFYAIALFLGAIGLVFKTKVRWGFSVIGWLGLVGSIVYTFSLPFA